MPFSPIEWPADSRVTLCKVPWDAAYKDVVCFESARARDDYFDAVCASADSVCLEKMTYLKPREPVTVNVPYSRAYRYNYLRVINPELPIPGETTPPVLYYFVTSVSYVAPNTTALELQLDVWTTYIYGCELGTGFLERGHLPMRQVYDADGGSVGGIESENLRRWCTTPEGLDVGSEYVVVNHEWKDISNASGGGWKVLITSTVDLTADWGTSSSPNLECAKGQRVDGLIGGCNVYTMATDRFPTFMSAIKKAPWAAKGIIDITCFPSELLSDGDAVNLGGVPANYLGDTPDTFDWFDTENIWEQLSNGIPPQYRWMRKFCCYPYSVIEWTNYQGSPLLLKPELCSAVEGKILMRATSCAANPGMRVAVWPLSYGGARGFDGSNQVIAYDYADMSGTKQGFIRTGNNLDNAVWFQGFPKFTLVNDEGTLSIAQRINSLNTSYAGAGWSLAKSNAANQLGFSQTMQSLDTARRNKDIQNIADVANGALSAVGSLAGGNYPATGKMAPGNVVGAALGGASTAIGLVAGNMQFANTQNLASSQASQNYNLAKWASQGDYEQTIAQIDASVQDAALTQPSIVGQSGGDGFNLANGYMGIEVRYKTLNEQMARVIGDYWGKYGYAAHEAVQMRGRPLNVMRYYTYWKFTDIYIESAECAEADKDAIRGIFAKGVTVWGDPADIGGIMPCENTPR